MTPKEKNLNIYQTFWIPPDQDKFDLVLHLETDDATSIMKELRDLGYTVDLREYTA